MSTITSGLLLPAGSHVTPEPILVQDYKSIQQIVGGPFDAVRTNMGHDHVALVGYVHDEGMLIPLEYNYIATALFKQNIFGDCVLVWGLDEDGIYDGDNHDIPEFMVEFLSEELMQHVAESYNISATIALILDYAVEFGVAEEDEVDMLMLLLMVNQEDGKSNREMMERIVEITDKCADHAEANPELAQAWYARNTKEEG